MNLFVVLVNWRNTTQTVECAAALKRWTKLKPTVVIVDNESTEATQRALNAGGFGDKVVCSPANSGYGGGNNLGVACAAHDAGSAILLLNSDVELTEASVEKLLARLERDPKLVIVGPILAETSNGGTRTFAGGRDMARHGRTRVAVDASRLGEISGFPLIDVDYVPGTVFLTRGAVFRDVGPLDEEFFFSGEIADFCRRARNKGYRLRVDLEAKAHHVTGADNVNLRDTLYAYYSLRNRFLNVRKHHDQAKLRYFVFWSLMAARGATAAVVRGQFRRVRAIGLAWSDGVFGRYGNQNAKFI